MGRNHPDVVLRPNPTVTSISMQTLDRMTVVLTLASSFYVQLSYCFYAREGGCSIWLQRTWVSTAVLLIEFFTLFYSKKSSVPAF